MSVNEGEAMTTNTNPKRAHEPSAADSRIPRRGWQSTIGFVWLGLRLASVLAFGWYVIHGPTVAVLVSGTFAVALLAMDSIANQRLIKGSWLIALGLPLGMAVCWGTGFLLVTIIGAQEAVYVGPGFDRWNRPGTILGIAVWIIITVWGVKRDRSCRKTPRRRREDRCFF